MRALCHVQKELDEERTARLALQRQVETLQAEMRELRASMTQQPKKRKSWHEELQNRDPARLAALGANNT